MKFFFLSAILLTWTYVQAQQVVRLYDGKAPGSENWTWLESGGADIVYNVSDPTLTAYLPPKSRANGTAIIIAPGGAFHTLSIINEGIDVAKWLNSKGIAAFILKYRLVKSETTDPSKEILALLATGNYQKLDSINAPIVPLAMADGLTAVKFLRQHSAMYHIDPQKIGFMGFSAGGTLAMSVIYNARDEDRPNFVAPVYAYEKAIIGTQIPKARTPIFIVAASNDDLGFASHSADIYLKWLNAKQPAELHMYERGGHGFGMRKNKITTDSWIELFGSWMKMQGYLDVSDICYTLFRGKTDHLFAGREMPQMH